MPETPANPAPDALAPGAPPPAPQLGGPEKIAQMIFLGPNGIRAGWRLLIWILLVAFFGVIISVSIHKIPALAQYQQQPVKGQQEIMTPGSLIVGEGGIVLALFLSVLVMSFIERKSFKDYGLPAQGAFGKRFWQGIAFGFASVSLLMAAIGALGGFSLGTLALTQSEIVKYGLLYGAGFLLVGFFEEFTFRGYLQATLGSGIGFWPAAVILAILFGAAHGGNGGEKSFGLIMAGLYGLFAAFTLSRTGNLWFAIGDHAAWDWGETYFYSTADSGALAKGHLLNSSFHGPNWLTGGTVGPEGSYLVFAVVALTFVAVHFLFPAKKSEAA